MTDADLNTIERRWNLVTGVWQESEGATTAPEVGPLVWQDMPRLIAEVKRLRVVNAALARFVDDFAKQIAALKTELIGGGGR